jgi:5-hydroxyisourate hydrolase
MTLSSGLRACALHPELYAVAHFMGSKYLSKLRARLEPADGLYSMSAITTHILDTSRGRPAGGVAVMLEVQTATESWELIGEGETDADGRLKGLLAEGHTFVEGIYRLTFDTKSYFASQNVESFYPEVNIVFSVGDATQHYHVPLLLNPYGYSTYRGS